jgi:hypothetical protein
MRRAVAAGRFFFAGAVPFSAWLRCGRVDFAAFLALSGVVQPTTFCCPRSWPGCFTWAAGLRVLHEGKGGMLTATHLDARKTAAVLMYLG